MRRAAAILSLVALFVATTRAVAEAQATATALDRQRAKAAIYAKENAFSRPAQLPGALMKGDTEPTSGTDITDEEITITLTPATDEFKVKSRVTMVARSPISTSSFLLSDVTVTSVTRVRDGAPLGYTHANGVLSVDHGRTLTTGESVSFAVAAEGPLPCDGNSQYCVIESRISHLLGVYMYPISYDGPWADRFNIDLTVDVPSNLLVSAPGQRMPIVTENGRARHRFVSYEPTPFLTLAVAEMVTSETNAQTSAGPVPVRIATLSSYSSAHDKFVKHTAAAVEFFASLFTAYPYGKLDVSMCNSAFSGGMAPQATFYIGEALFRSGDAGWNELILEVFSHETAHQWFGNHVAPSSQRSNWLSEGFAEYLAVIHSNARTGKWAHLHGAQEDYMSWVGPSNDGPIDGPGPSAYFQVVYEKGAAVLHMLRRLIGDTAFFSGMRSYIEKNASERVPISTFEKSMANAAGTDLTAFFNVWLRDTGYPKFVVTSEMASTPHGLVARVTISEPSGRAFPMRVPLEVLHEQGTSRIEVVLDKASQTFDVPVPSLLLGVRVDKEREALRYLQPGLPGDVNASGRVDGGDLLDLAANYGLMRGGDSWDEMADVDGNNEIDEADVNAVKANWGLTTGGR